MSQDFDPALGDPRFVSSKRGSARSRSPGMVLDCPIFVGQSYRTSDRIDWSSIPPAITFGYPVLQPRHSTERRLVVPLHVRELIQTYSCLHR